MFNVVGRNMAVLALQTVRFFYTSGVCLAENSGRIVVLLLVSLIFFNILQIGSIDSVVIYLTAFVGTRIRY